MELKLLATQQQGIIEFNFEELKKELTERTEHYRNLIVTEDSIKESKNDRAKLNKLEKEVEDKRKAIKKEYLQPYSDFEGQVKELVSIIRSASSNIDTQVKAFETAEIEKKTNLVRGYFMEKLPLEIDFVSFDDLGLKIGLSNSVSGLEKDVDNYIAAIQSDLNLIDTQAHKERILVRYKQSKNASEAIMSVNREIEQEEALKARREQETLKANEIKTEPIQTPNEPAIEPITEIKEPEEIMTITFSVTGTRTQLKEVREFMKERGIKYESAK